MARQEGPQPSPRRPVRAPDRAKPLHRHQPQPGPARPAPVCCPRPSALCSSPNPVKALSITQGRDGVALKLSVTAAPAGHILLYASRPYNAGRHYCDKFIYLGPLPAPAEARATSPRSTLRSTACPGPARGSSSASWQQVNGWRDHPQRIEAVFRPSPGPASPAQPPPSPRRRPITPPDTPRIPPGYPPGAHRSITRSPGYPVHGTVGVAAIADCMATIAVLSSRS